MLNRIRVAAALTALVAAAAALTACGGSSTAAAGGAASAAPGRSGFQAYLTCLSQHGVTLPSASPRGNRPTNRPSREPGARPGGGFGLGNQPPAGVDEQTWQKAQQACASVRPTGGPQNRNNDAFTAYRNCLADHGVTMSRGPGALDANDPKVAVAMKACEALRPSARPAPSATG